ncbi:hypothetical protein VTL71DRAFT_7908 [Oculimacula yallundae]|uniref:Uncharacterized protein n=1 Tax=Oculimacula yallundae TaxID=86028 RepID=A0ABR4CW66_9HELO
MSQKPSAVIMSQAPRETSVSHDTDDDDFSIKDRGQFNLRGLSSEIRIAIFKLCVNSIIWADRLSSISSKPCGRILACTRRCWQSITLPLDVTSSQCLMYASYISPLFNCLMAEPGMMRKKPKNYHRWWMSYGNEWVVKLPLLSRLVLELPMATTTPSKIGDNEVLSFENPIRSIGEALGCMHKWLNHLGLPLSSVAVAWEAGHLEKLTWTDDKYWKSKPYANMERTSSSLSPSSDPRMAQLSSVGLAPQVFPATTSLPDAQDMTQEEKDELAKLYCIFPDRFQAALLVTQRANSIRPPGSPHDMLRRSLVAAIAMLQANQS